MAPINSESLASASLAGPTTTTTRTTTIAGSVTARTTINSLSDSLRPDLVISPEDHLTDSGDSQLSIRLVGDKGQYHSLADWRKLSNPSSYGDNILENQTFALPIQTSFRLDDYSLYDQDTEHADHGIKQNQMLPIYCSIMGLIILFLLCYVVYKLWKQREAITTAKLTEVYTSSGSCGKGELGSHRHLSDSAGRLVQCSAVSNQSPQSFNKTSSDNANSRRLHRHVNGYETEPLLGNLNGMPSTNGYADHPLNVVPLNVRALLCYRLSQQGWRELASALNVDIPNMSDQTCASPELFKASLDMKAANEPRNNPLNTEESCRTQTDDLRQTVNLIHELGQQNRITVTSLCLCLHKINRPDLIALLQPTLPDLNPNQIPTDLGSSTLSHNQV